jgi:hypothetical protein
MSYDWLSVQNALDGVSTDPRITYLSVNGTGVDLWTGFPADIGRALDDEKYLWQPIGYPGDTFPMGPSVQAGVTELVNQINLHPGQFVLCGYSQGAIVTSKVWRDFILNPNGSLHNRLPDVVGHITFGNPMRSPGIANGNVYAGQPLPALSDGVITGGIAGPDCLTADQTPAFMLDFAHDGDMYASCPVGPNPWNAEQQVGYDETLIYNIIQNITVADVMAVAEEVLKVMFDPWTEVVPLVEAIYNAGLFFAQGMNSPHFTYDTGPAIAWLDELAVTSVAA